MGLYVDQKKNKILEIIYSEGKVSTRELSIKLKLSTETIRRYLENLENESKIRRIHGGAVKLNSYTSEEPIGTRISKMEREKRKIAKAASELISDGEKIIIDEGTTTLQLVNYLEGKKDLVIITSSFPVAIGIMSLINNKKIEAKLVFLGGEVQCDNKRTVGSECIDMVDKYLVDKAFISCEGVSLEHGITAYDSLKSEVSRKYIKQATEIILLTDYSKVGIRNFYKIEELIKIDRIISNKSMPLEWKEKLKSWKIEWQEAN
ncbi:DeoR/GlpR family DNA-binding transcription regulator [Clostridium paraputrificum]|uniref:DeoR/GlpR family DNA-binding transcription regulator n=1 Tax=Clostridium TaxID=1485 RepID=UPI003D32559E